MEKREEMDYRKIAESLEKTSRCLFQVDGCLSVNLICLGGVLSELMNSKSERKAGLVDMLVDMLRQFLPVFIGKMSKNGFGSEIIRAVYHGSQLEYSIAFVAMPYQASITGNPSQGNWIVCVDSCVDCFQ